ncbi:exo-beta-1,3-glucanase [Sparassis latifolia]
MLVHTPFPVLVIFMGWLIVSGHGSLCISPLVAGNSTPSQPFWLEDMVQRGTSAFNADPATYQVYRNVKDYGATGDGVTDDTAAVNYAISFGDRCGEGCGSATLWYLKSTYLVSEPIIAYYYTVIVGDAKVPPTILAAPNFTGIAVIDADPYDAYGNWYTNQDNFYRSVRNFVIDLTQMPASASATGIHWQVSQATSLMNLVFDMSTEPENNHQGIYMEDGSGGFMGDMVFNGGKYGLWVGNQQFTVRNITVNGANTGEPVYGLWSWGWTYQRININNCEIGFDLTIGTANGSAQGIGSEAIIDATVTNTPIFVQRSATSNHTLDGSLVLSNVQLDNVTTAVGVVGGEVLLAGGTLRIDAWAQGNVYAGSNPNGTYTQGYIDPLLKSPVVLDSTGKIFSKGHPQYADYSASQFMSVKSQGAAGDGHTDDTAVIQRVFDEYAGCYIIYFDAGTYIVTSTITIPAGTQVVGEAWSTIMGSGAYFQNMDDPQVVVRVGEPYSYGLAEITDMIFTARGPAAGAIVVEWNVHDPAGQQGAAGAWDTHIMSNGSDLQAYNCAAAYYDVNTECYAAFLALHLTPGSSAYLEGLWVWLADHDLDWPGNAQVSLYSGRGILSESLGPAWLIGTAEHNVMYQYSLVGAQNHYIGTMQTETPYFQPDPAPPAPFTPNPAYLDPEAWFGAALALQISSAENILVYGAGFYSFFQNYTQTCEATFSCQMQIVNVDTLTSVGIYGLQTVDSTYMLSVDDNGVISYTNNRNGFAETITAWTPWA